jgi:hypothetical protein
MRQWRDFLPIVAGILSGFIMLQRPEGPPTNNLFSIALAETPFFLVGAIVGCFLMPRRALFAAFLILFGVSLGVFLDVAVHPNTKEGFERNLFPLEMFLHTLFAAPSVLAVSGIFQVVVKQS